MNIRCLIVPLAAAFVGIQAVGAAAESAFPAPLPGQPQNDPAFPPVNGGVQKNDPAFPPVNGAKRSDPAFPPVNGAPSASLGAPAAFPSGGAAPLSGGFSPMGGPPPGGGPVAGGPAADCMKGFMPLRQETERRGKLIQAAGKRHAPPQEACKLIASFSQSEMKMIRYVEGNQKRCGIPAQIADQLKNGHKRTEALQSKVCGIAQQQERGPAGPSLADVLGSSASMPEATASKKGGSTFDTLTGNVLTR